VTDEKGAQAPTNRVRAVQATVRNLRERTMEISASVFAPEWTTHCVDLSDGRASSLTGVSESLIPLRIEKIQATSGQRFCW